MKISTSDGWSTATLGLGFDVLPETTPDALDGLRLWLKADDLVDGPEPALGAAVIAADVKRFADMKNSPARLVAREYRFS